VWTDLSQDPECNPTLTPERWRLLAIGFFAEVIRRKLTLNCSNRALGFDLLQGKHRSDRAVSIQAGLPKASKYSELGI
jgi:hypothetical protein